MWLRLKKYLCSCHFQDSNNLPIFLDYNAFQVSTCHHVKSRTSSTFYHCTCYKNLTALYSASSKLIQNISRQTATIIILFVISSFLTPHNLTLLFLGEYYYKLSLFWRWCSYEMQEFSFVLFLRTCCCFLRVFTGLTR